MAERGPGQPVRQDEHRLVEAVVGELEALAAPGRAPPRRPARRPVARPRTPGRRRAGPGRGSWRRRRPRRRTRRSRRRAGGGQRQAAHRVEGGDQAGRGGVGAALVEGLHGGGDVARLQAGQAVERGDLGGTPPRRVGRARDRGEQLAGPVGLAGVGGGGAGDHLREEVEVGEAVAQLEELLGGGQAIGHPTAHDVGPGQHGHGLGLPPAVLEHEELLAGVLGPLDGVRSRGPSTGAARRRARSSCRSPNGRRPRAGAA